MKSANPILSSTASSRRAQPPRQTRTNPPRSSVLAGGRSTSFGRSAGAGAGAAGVGEHEATAPSAPGFFPAITHFTDCITALPREMIRHFTLLKEVDAKACGPEETLAKLTDIVLSTPPPAREMLVDSTDVKMTDVAEVSGGNDSVSSNAPVSSADPTQSNLAAAEGEAQDTYDMTRRHMYYNLRYTLKEMLLTLDEKNHVLSTANEALNKQLLRIDSSFPYIDNEISDEARYGSLTHWAYTEKGTLGKANGAAGGHGDRSRREVAAANNLAAAAAAMTEDAASRSETRREAMLARKQRNNPHLVDSDFDDAAGRGRNAGSAQPPNGKKVSNPKVRKGAEAAGSVGLGISSAATATPAPLGNPPTKRRKTEKAAANGTGGMSAQAMERTPSNVVGSVGTAKNDGATASEGRKRARGAAAAAAGPARKRHNTNTSGNASPSMASSPVHGTFAIPKETHRSSPAPGNGTRPASTRARQNSSQSIAQDAHIVSNGRPRPSSSASNKVNGISNAADPNNSTTSAARASAADTKNTKDGSKSEKITEGDMRDGESRSGAPMTTSKPSERSLKKEDANDNGNGHIRHTSVTTTTTRGGRQSKTATPVTSTFAESHGGTHNSRSRSSRNGTTEATSVPASTTREAPPKRSHKKGAGAAAQAAHHQPHGSATSTTGASGGASAAADADRSGASGRNRGGAPNGGEVEDDEEEEGEEGDEPRYCYCNGVSYGEMVACDADACVREWFHLDCVGLEKAPGRNAKWYCDECKDRMRKEGRRGNNAVGATA
ncbi:MAG: hypothetical protein M1817_003080 [Caeruleum heppii]|nr:MAG: hypothetical protein M1817_003080 [Caeruleum heppii]